MDLDNIFKQIQSVISQEPFSFRVAKTTERTPNASVVSVLGARNVENNFQTLRWETSLYVAQNKMFGKRIVFKDFPYFIYRSEFEDIELTMISSGSDFLDSEKSIMDFINGIKKFFEVYDFYKKLKYYEGTDDLKKMEMLELILRTPDYVQDDKMIIDMEKMIYDIKMQNKIPMSFKEYARGFE